MKKTLLTMLLVAAGTSFLTTLASAQSNEIVFGFQKSGITLDLAGLVTLTDPTFSTQQTFDLGTVGTAANGFSSTFGAGWATDSTLKWGAALTNGDNTTNPTNTVSSPQLVGGAESAGKNSPGFGNSQALVGRIQNAEAGVTSANGNTAVTGSTILIHQDSTANNQAWRLGMAQSSGGLYGNADWGFFTANSTQATFSAGVSGKTVDLYTLPVANGSPGIDIGDIGLFYNSNTDHMFLTFTPDSLEAVPEPSTYALVGLGIALIAFRRWRVARAA